MKKMLEYLIVQYPTKQPMLAILEEMKIYLGPHWDKWEGYFSGLTDEQLVALCRGDSIECETSAIEIEANNLLDVIADNFL